MADDESTNTGSDDSTVVDDDGPILPDESVEVKETEGKESKATDESDTKEESAEETDKPEAHEDETKESDSEAQADEPEEGDEATSKESVDPKEIARQAFLHRQADRQARETQRQQQLQEYVAEADDEKEQAVRQLQAELYNQRVQSTEQSLVSDFERASAEIPLFNPSKPEFNQLALNDAIQEYNNGHINYDENGNMVGVKTPFKDYLKYKANLYGELTQVGARKGQRAESKMRARAETPSAASTKEPKSDPFLQGFDKEDY